MLSNPSSKPIVTMTIQGYIPPSKNSIKGSHWSVLHKEKTRAAHALKSLLESMDSSLMIGTTLTPKSCKTCLSELVSYMVTHGMFYKGASSLVRHTKKKKKERKLKS